MAASLLTWGYAVEGLMRIGRAVIIPTILAIAITGPVIATTATASAAPVSNVQVVPQGTLMSPAIYYYI